MNSLDESEERPKNSKGITIIAVWMILLMVPGIYRVMQFGFEAIVSHSVILEWAYYICSFICAVGLLKLKEWARRRTVYLFIIQFIGVLVAVTYLQGPAWNQIIEWQSQNYNISPESLKVISIALILVFMFWQIWVILYLTHPKIRSLFVS